MIELVRVRRRQALARDEQLYVPQALGGTAIPYAAHLRHEITLGRPKPLDFKACCAILALQRSIILDRQGIRGEGLQLHLTANAMGAADLSNADAIGRHGDSSFRGPSQRVRPAAGPLTGSAADPGIDN